MEFSNNDIKNVSQYIAKFTSTSSNDLCFCGSTNIYAECCKNIPKYWLTPKFLNELIGFSKSKMYTVKSIPISFFTKLELSFQNTFDKCARPGCPNKCIGSHVFGGSQMKCTFKNSVCSWYAIDDLNKRALKPVGISNELKYKIFCESCDNNIFKKY